MPDEYSSVPRLDRRCHLGPTGKTVASNFLVDRSLGVVLEQRFGLYADPNGTEIEQTLPTDRSHIRVFGIGID